MTVARPAPPRSIHLWRHTPWTWMAPDAAVVESLHVNVHPPSPSCLADGGGVHLHAAGKDRFSTMVHAHEYTRPDVEDVARATLDDAVEGGHQLDLHGDLAEVIHVDLVANGEAVAGRLHVRCTGHATLHLHLSGDASWCGLHLTGDVTDGAHLAVAVTDELGKHARFLRCDDWNIGRDARLISGTLSTGGFRRKSDLRHHLNATGGDVRIGIGVHGRGERHDDHHVEIHHHLGHTTSSLVANTACGDASRSIGTGRLVIAPGADGSDAGQVFRNLLLSESARADAIPELEVLADDVAAAHGAASAAIDEGQVHYLMCRGLDRASAEDLVVEGLLAAAFSELNHDRLVGVLRDRLIVHLDCAQEW